jgi:hypothetical protein
MALTHDADLSKQVIAAAIEVHKGLGPGLLDRSTSERSHASCEAAGARCSRKSTWRFSIEIKLSESA